MKSVSSEVDLAETADGQKIYNVSKSRLMGLVNWIHVFGTYLPHVWFIVVGVLLFQVFMILYDMKFDLQQFYTAEVATLNLSRGVVFDLGWKSMALLALLLWYVNHREKPVYLLDFHCFEPPEKWKLSPEQLLNIMKMQGTFTDESIEFLAKLLERSGCGPSTAWPPSIVQCLDGLPADRSVEGARKEAEVVIYDCVEKLLRKTNIDAKGVDILIINCSLFSPTPSLCSMVINKFGMRSDISSYNLSGMGCSAGVISIDLARNLMASRPNTTALVVSTENLTQNLYLGNEKSFLLQNTLFRCGGAAVMLSNKWLDGHRSNFKLLTTIRTQYVTDQSIECVYETEDAKSNRGIRLSKDIVKVAGRAMEQNFTTLGPYVLSVSEQLKAAFWMSVRFVAKRMGMKKSDIPTPYVPDFKKGIDHFCIHAGGRGVIDGIEKNLNLTPKHVEPSRYTLRTYGNTSSSSIWYEMDYVRKNMELKTGHRVLQIAFGSGFKCNSAVWLCINNNIYTGNNGDNGDADKKNK